MQNSRGFTLIEALAVLAIAAVLASVAAPSLGALVDSTRLSTVSNELLGDLLLTRSESVKRKLRVVMCKSAEGQSCSAGDGWHQGWIVFVDEDGDGLRDTGESVLRTRAALGGALRLTGTSPVAKYVSYAPNGSTKTVGGGFQAGTLTLCSRSPGPSPGRQIVINANGRPRTQKVQLPSCG